jgi:ADP-ribose pyrophosphatase
MIRNHREAVGKTLLELPAGTIDPGETPLATARRELKEETGYTAGRIRKVAEFYPSPGILNECMHLYVAENLKPGEQDLDDGEELEPVILDWEEAVGMALSGKIKDAKTLVGVLLWERKRVLSAKC